MLVTQGDEFEVRRIMTLIDELGPEAVYSRGLLTDGERTTIAELPFTELADRLRSGLYPRFATQIRIEFEPAQKEAFLRRYRLDPGRVDLSAARPDLIEFIPADVEAGRYLLRVRDIKSSRAARHEHFIQVAFYSLLLEHACAALGFTNIIIDETGVIDCREGAVEFDLAPYRLAIEGFLRNSLPDLLATMPLDAHFHLTEGCTMCPFDKTCRDEASAANDISLIPYLSSESKRQLRLHGLRAIRDVALLEGSERYDTLRESCYDLSLHIDRYIAAAQALGDGQVRPLEGRSLLMPNWEDVRVVLAAEQDPVTGTCFAIGMRIARYNRDARKFAITERIYLAQERGDELSILVPFLHDLNDLLCQIDASNRAIGSAPIDEEPTVGAAAAEHAEAAERLSAFKTHHPHRLLSADPESERLKAERDALRELEFQTSKRLKDARKGAARARRGRMEKLHFYFYDPFDLDILKRTVERHLFDDHPGLLDEVRNLVRLFPPDSVMKDVETFRSIPGSALTHVLRTMVALPVPYMFDLKTVSASFVIPGEEGDFRPFVYRPAFGFDWAYTNQIAFERIHDVWNGRSFRPDPRRPERDIPPDRILEGLRRTIRDKLRATDSLILGVRKLCGAGLILKKEPFFLSTAFDPTDFQRIEALRVFNQLEVSLQDLEVRGLHALPVADRQRRLVCMRGLECVGRVDNAAWFTFDPDSRDSAFDVGDFNLVLTPEAYPEVLIDDVDGPLFSRFGSMKETARVTVKAYDLSTTPPRVLLQPHNPKKFFAALEQETLYALDSIFIDYNSDKVEKVLAALAERPDDAAHVGSLLHDIEVDGWSPFVRDVDALADELQRRLARVDGGLCLNQGQWRAWRGVFSEPMTLIWGPPGTGKTQTLAAILLGYALAAQRDRLPLSILVTAFTHAAIDNLLAKIASLARDLDLDSDTLRIARLRRGEEVESGESDAGIELVPNEQMLSLLSGRSGTTIVGATVWGAVNGVREKRERIQRLFDVVLIDEASQMRLPEAVLPLSLSKPTANIILAGDDKQLPPIIKGEYPEQHEFMLSSVFAFMRHRVEELERTRGDIVRRSLFQLNENFRMNEPLTAFPRDPLYRGDYIAAIPDRRLHLEGTGEKGNVLDLLLDPDRPVVLISYASPRSYTVRNPVEASLVVALAERLSGIMTDAEGTLLDPVRFAEEGLALLAPHRAQNSLIRRMLEQKGFGVDRKPFPLVNTVEKLQGQERDVILVSYGVADEEFAEAEASFLLNSNRLNVSVTRGRSKVVLVCSERVLDLVPNDRLVAQESMLLKSFRLYCSEGSMRFVWEGVEMMASWRGWGGKGVKQQDVRNP